MSYHPNQMYAQPPRQSSAHSYGSTYPGPGMPVKSNAGAQQVNVAPSGYGHMYVMPPVAPPFVNQQYFPQGNDGKYSNRGVTDTGGQQVIFPMYPAQHMGATGAMLLQGQQMVAMGHPQIYQQQPAHQNRLRYPSPAPANTNQYGMGIPQQQPQQSYYKPPMMPGMMTNDAAHQQQPTQAAPKREKKILQIVNPNTGKEVNIKEDAGQSPPAEPVVSVMDQNQPSHIAAQFAAQVAATLHPSGNRSIATASNDDYLANQQPASTPLDTKCPDGSEITEVIESEHKDTVYTSDKDTPAKQQTPEEATVLPVSSTVPSEQTSHLSNANVFSETEKTKASDVQQPQPQIQQLPPKASNGPLLEACTVDESAKSKTVKASSKAPAIKDTPQLPQVQQQNKPPGSASVDAISESSASAITVSDQGNKKKNKKKGKDFNNKGKVHQGSDMDAFIDDNIQENSQKGKSSNEISSTVESSDKEKEDVESVSSLETQPPQSTSGESVQDVVPGDDPTTVVAEEEKVVLETEKLPEESTSEIDKISSVLPETTHDVQIFDKDDSHSIPQSKVEDVKSVEESKELLHDVAAKSDEPSLHIDPVSEIANLSEAADAKMQSGSVEKRCDAKTFQADMANHESNDDNVITTAAVETAPSVASDKELDGEASTSGTEVEVAASEPVKSNKTELKYTYAEDQWSPLNPEGKKRYDRNFMLQLQFAQPSVIKPDNLAQLPDIILNELRTKADYSRQPSVDPMSPVDFTPGFIKQIGGGGGSSRGPIRHGGGGSGMKRGGGGKEQQRKVINVTIEQNITLHTADNAWKPAVSKGKEGDLATEEVYKRVRGILNKLTPQKFKTLIQQVLQLPINTEERLTGCIDIVFEKAISEPSFSVAYANMALYLTRIQVQLDSDPTKTVAFQKLLLNKCQHEFEKDKLDEEDIQHLQGLIDGAESDESKKQLIEKRDETRYRAKRRSLGNIRFIGELFKLKMLTEKIMHECLRKLLQSNEDEDSLECLCQLLTTIGQDIDKKSQNMMNKYFGDLLDLVDQKKTSSRIRFMIQDIIELRKNAWVPRRQNNNPKTIEQIHKEAEQEEQEKQLALQKFTQDQRNRRGPPSGAARVGTPLSSNAHPDDGWTAVSRAPKSIVDPARMKLTKQPMDENVQLGPGGKGMSAWHRGSSGGGKTLSQECEKPTSTPNRFSALGAYGSESMDARSRTGGRVGGGYTGRLSGPQSRGPASKQSEDRSSNESHFRAPGGMGRNAGIRSPAGSRSASQEARNPRERMSSEQRANADVAAARSGTEEKEISEAEIEKKTKSLMDEYLHGHDIKEAALCVKELGSTKSLQLFVYHSLLQNLERSSQARNFTGMLHLYLVNTKQMAIGHYIEGLRSVLELADEMVIDIPRIWDYLGELIFPMVEDGSVPFTFIRNACEPLQACDKAGVVVASVLHEAARKLGHHKAAALWLDSGLKWSEFMTADAVQVFLEEQKLHFIEDQKATATDATGRLSAADQIQDRLCNLLDDPETSVEKLIDWIEEAVDEQASHSTSFVRAFATSLCSSCLKKQKNTTSVDQEKFKKYLPVLGRCVANQMPLEVQALYALQALVHKLEHPPGLLRAFFDILYDDEVISEGAFYAWRDSSEPSETNGRGVALSSVTQFFHWLESEEDS